MIPKQNFAVVYEHWALLGPGQQVLSTSLFAFVDGKSSKVNK